MLAKRIIPCLDIDRGRVVKGVNFINLKDAGSPVKNAKFYEKEGADELVFLDITASYQKRSTIVALVKKVAEVIFMPFTVGGGIRSIADIRRLLLSGADKVSLNTAAVKNPVFIKKASEVFGSQCIVAAIDAKLRRMKPCLRAGKDEGRRMKKMSLVPAKRSSPVHRLEWEVYINGGRTPTGLDAVSWAKEAERLGAGEILLTSMDYDGTKDGYDLGLTRAVTKAVKIPVIASGGAGKPAHFYDLFRKTQATAALAASIFHYRHYRVRQIKGYLKKKRIGVRE